MMQHHQVNGLNSAAHTSVCVQLFWSLIHLHSMRKVLCRYRRHLCCGCMVLLQPGFGCSEHPHIGWRCPECLCPHPLGLLLTSLSGLWRLLALLWQTPHSHTSPGHLLEDWSRSNWALTTKHLKVCKTSFKSTDLGEITAYWEPPVSLLCFCIWGKD